MTNVFECTQCNRVGHVITKSGNEHQVVCDCGNEWTCYTPTVEMTARAKHIYDEAMKGYVDTPVGPPSKYGVYRVYWKSGGSSVASIGGMRNGDLWIAPSNWTGETNPTGLLKNVINDIDRFDLIATK